MAKNLNWREVLIGFIAVLTVVSIIGTGIFKINIVHGAKEKEPAICEQYIEFLKVDGCAEVNDTYWLYRNGKWEAV